jgi:hypothetical protein
MPSKFSGKMTLVIEFDNDTEEALTRDVEETIAMLRSAGFAFDDPGFTLTVGNVTKTWAELTQEYGL